MEIKSAVLILDVKDISDPLRLYQLKINYWCWHFNHSLDKENKNINKIFIELEFFL